MIRHCFFTRYGNCPVLVLLVQQHAFSSRGIRTPASIRMSIEYLTYLHGVTEEEWEENFSLDAVDGDPEYSCYLYCDCRERVDDMDRLEHYRQVLEALGLVVPISVFNGFILDITTRSHTNHNVRHHIDGRREEFDVFGDPEPSTLETTAGRPTSDHDGGER